MRGAVGGGCQARQNAMRSGLVVLGAVAFGFLSFRVGFEPYLDQEVMDTHDSASSASGAAQPDHAGEGDVATSKDPAVVLPRLRPLVEASAVVAFIFVGCAIPSNTL